MTDYTETGNKDNNKPEKYKAKKTSFFILGVIIFALSIALAVYWESQVKTRAPKPTPVKQTIVSLTSVKLANNTAIISAGGFVNAKDDSQISAEVSGKIIAVSPNLAIGQTLKKGEVLAQIDKTTYEAALANAQANLLTAQSNLQQEQAKSRQAARDAQRLKIKATPLLLRTPQLNAAQARLDNAKAQLNLAKSNLDKTTIKSPFNAIVAERYISIGDNLTPNTPIAKLLGTDTFTVKLTVDSHNYSLLEIGNPVVLTNPNTDIHYKAAINRFSPTINKSTRTVGVYVDIANPMENSNPLLVNTYLTAKITGKNIPNSQWIDNKSIINNQFLWTTDTNQQLIKVPLNIIQRNKRQSLVQFTQPIDNFISQPQESFYAGKKVTSVVN